MPWRTALLRLFKKLPVILVVIVCYTAAIFYIFHRKMVRDHVNTEQFTNLAVATGNLTCADEEECATWRLLTPRQAKVLCEVYIDKCEGFVFTSSHGVYFKTAIKGMLNRHPGHTLFVKKAHAQGIEKPLDMCAVKMEERIASDFQDRCKLDEFNPFDKNIMQFMKKQQPLRCNGQQKTRYRNGYIEFLPGVNVSKAVYIPITRIPGKDWGYRTGNSISLDTTMKKNPVQHEFIRVETTTEDNKNHIEYHATVVPKPDVLDRPRHGTGLPLNVMMIGFDSLSRAHFERVFPETFKYMKNELKSVVMNGYTIVGDGTTPALTAFLTGQFEKDLPEARRGFEGSATVDRWPWIFKEFRSAGYATMFSEDCPAYAAFNYRLHGFNNTPTDHFSRYFWESAEITQSYCIHAKPQHMIHLDYIETFFEAYSKTPKFGVAFFTEVSHNNLNSIQLCVHDFTSFLKTLRDKNFLNDTMLILFGDHGFRYGDSRATLQGHLEERLPLLTFTFPSWFEKTHPKTLKNVRHNANTVTSPFDLHATLRHILTYPDIPKTAKHSRGTSMLLKISKSRDCETASIPEHYCPCLKIKTADTKHRHIMLGSEALVRHINMKLSSDENSAVLCHQLKLKKIVSSLQEMPNSKFQQFLGSADIHGRVPKFSEVKKELKECNYRVQIQTSPGDGLFEAPVRFNDGNFTVTGDISRINKYGEQPRCILDKRPDLRKYCLCKDYN